jgi:hypothetical protein
MEVGPWPGRTPSQGYVGPVPCLATGSVRGGAGREVVGGFTEWSNGWAAPRRFDAECSTPVWRGIASQAGDGLALGDGGDSRSRVWRLAPRADAVQVAPVQLDDLSGRYTVLLRSQFFDQPVGLEIDQAGVVCISLVGSGTSPVPPCAIRGQVSLVDGATGFVDFELASALTPLEPPYRGRGWIEQGSGGRVLVLIGDNGVRGLGLVAR